MTGTTDEADWGVYGEINQTLSEVLSEGGLVSPEALLRAQQAASAKAQRLDKTLVALGLLTEEQSTTAVASSFDYPHVQRLDEITVSEATRPLFEASYLHRFRFIPIDHSDKQLIVVMADPLDANLISSIEFHCERQVAAAIAAPSLISEALERHFPLEETGAQIVSQDIATDDIERLEALANEGPVVRLVQDILTTAVDRKASDIHFEAREAGLMIRMRKDGQLEDFRHETQLKASAVFSRIKVLARLNISERRQPQDGRIQLAIRGRDVDFRVSTLPTQFGESAVLRVLDRETLNLDFAGLGFSEELTTRIKAILDMPNGLFLVTGPTGSGKTTTLYTALQYLNRPNLKLCSVEDPIEYSLEGVNQVQVHSEIDFSFAKALRALLRQDPNVIMVGEIRDAETAQIACRAALVGRLVLSTLHVNAPREAETRLLDLGVEPYLLRAVLRGVLGQTLEPRVCAGCGGEGCERCGQSGFEGRVVIGELA